MSVSAIVKTPFDALRKATLLRHLAMQITVEGNDGGLAANLALARVVVAQARALANKLKRGERDLHPAE